MTKHGPIAAAPLSWQAQQHAEGVAATKMRTAYLIELLRNAESYTQAAQIAGMDRTMLHKECARLGVSKDRLPAFEKPQKPKPFAFKRKLTRAEYDEYIDLLKYMGRADRALEAMGRADLAAGYREAKGMA
ncbi:hypothetical protein [Loktanella sp. R86503]|uniref:hypothetical protein n=1 Tax=Loktanella sp. R86503 TaxID=3093847 RepID=UPI0036D7B2CF